MSDQAEPEAVPVLYLDLDGTVRHDKGELGHFINGPDDVTLFPEAVEMMRRWTAGGGLIVGVSNQGGIAMGHVTLRNVRAANDRTQELSGHAFRLITFCQHHPSAPDPAQRECWCRKPSPGMIFMSMEKLVLALNQPCPPNLALMVGDRPEDQECAARAGIDFQWAKEWRAQA